MERDSEGFTVPFVGDYCDRCGLCGTVCPELAAVPRRKAPEEVFAVWCNDEEDRLASSSGGFFRILSREILGAGGAVFGAAFRAGFELKHRCGRSEEECRGFSGSKYLQSNTSGVYREVAALLEAKAQTLFSGTPCQVAGLYGYLRGDCKSLITCDLVCTGVPSPTVFRDYLTGLEKRFGCKAIQVHFRDKSGKRPRFTVRFADCRIYSKELYSTDFGYGFGAAMFLRKSCGSCRYADDRRVGDFTLGDFWGLKVPHDTSKGVSLVMANSEKGRALMSTLPPVFTSVPRELFEAVAGNARLENPVKHSPKRAEFFDAYTKLPFDRAVQEIMPSKTRRLAGKIYRVTKSRIGGAT